MIALHMSELDDQHRRFESLWLERKFTEAYPLAESNLAQARALYPQGHPQLVQALLDAAISCQSQERLADAQAAEAEARELLERLRQDAQAHPEEPATADLLIFLADREWVLSGNQTEVLSKLAQALAIREGLYGKNDPRTAEAVALLAEAHYVEGRLKDAETLYRRAMAAYEQAGKKTDYRYGKCVEGLAMTLAQTDRFKEAEPYFEDAIKRATSEGQTRMLYFLLIAYAEGLERQGRVQAGQAARDHAQELLPKANPGEWGFRIP